MQRWWFLDNKSKLDQSPSLVSTPSIASEEVVEKLRPWTFRVFVNQPLSKFEAIGVTGECASLGSWDAQRGVELQKDDESKFFFNLLTISPRNMFLHMFD